MYSFYGQFKGEFPYSTAVIFVHFCQMLHFFLILVFLKVRLNLNILEYMPDGYKVWIGLLIL